MAPTGVSPQKGKANSTAKCVKSHVDLVNNQPAFPARQKAISARKTSEMRPVSSLGKNGMLIYHNDT